MLKMHYISVWKEYLYNADRQTDRCLLRSYSMTLKHSDDIYTSEQLIPKAGYI